MRRERPEPKPNPLLSRGWICVGRFLAAHGVKGLIRLASYTEEPETVFAFSDLRCGTALEPVKARKAGRHKGDFLASVEGAETPEAACQLAGKNIYAARSELPALERGGEFYQADLIGLTVRDKNGNKAGTAIAFHDYGAGPLLEIGIEGKGKSRTVLVPFTDNVVLGVDLKRREIAVDLTDWL